MTMRFGSRISIMLGSYDLETQAVSLDLDPRWLELVAEVQDRRVELRDNFLRGFPVAEKYGDDAVASADVVEVVDDSLEMFLLQLAGTPLPERLQSFPERLGTRRAGQGVPESLLLEGVRTNFAVLWEAFKQAAGEAEPELLVAQVETLIGLVEQQVSRVQRAYLTESQRLSQDTRRTIDHALARFITGDLLSQSELTLLAEALGAPSDGELWVALLSPSGVPLERLLAPWRASLSWQGVFVLLSPDHTQPDLPAEARGVITRHPAPLDRLPALVREMTRLTTPLQHSGVAYLDDLVLHSAHASAAGHFDDPASVLGRDFFEIREVEQTRLRETLRAFAETGTVGGAAALLFCHRNTVVTRMRRVEALTGYNPLVPRQLAILAVFLGLW